MHICQIKLVFGGPLFPFLPLLSYPGFVPCFVDHLRDGPGGLFSPSFSPSPSLLLFVYLVASFSRSSLPPSCRDLPLHPLYPHLLLPLTPPLPARPPPSTIFNPCNQPSLVCLSHNKYKGKTDVLVVFHLNAVCANICFLVEVLL